MTDEKRSKASGKHLQRELEWVRAAKRGQQGKSRARVRAYHELLAATKDNAANKRLESGSLLIPDGPELDDSIAVEMKDVSVVWDDDIDGNSGTPRELLKPFSLTVNRGDIIGIVGPNGAGKSTILRLITGERRVHSGTIKVAPSVRVGYNAQQRELPDDLMVWQAIVGLQETVPIDAGYAMPARAYVAQFNFSGVVQQKRIHQLSGGERNRVALAHCMVRGVNMLLLDEPTNDLDVDTLRLLEDALSEWAGTAVIVSHDRWFLDRIVNRLVIVENKQVTTWDGDWSSYEAYKNRSNTNTNNNNERKQKFRKIHA